jgi:hypothetical protein
MDGHAWLSRYAAFGLLAIGGLEWFLGRVVSRFAAVPPLEGFGRTVVETLGGTGLFLISTAFILATTLFFTTTLKLGERANRTRSVGGLALAIYLTIFGVFLVAHAILTAFKVFADEAWLNVTFNILSAIAMWWLSLRFILATDDRRPTTDDRYLWTAIAIKLGVLLVAAAYSGWYYSVLYSWLSRPGATGTIGPADILRLGELMAVLAPLAFFVGIALPAGEWRNAKRWIAPLILALLFSVGNIADIIANQGYIGVFAIWSVGFTLWLPWPIYGLSLALFAFSILTCFARPVQDGGRWTTDRPPSTVRYATMNRGMGLVLLLFAEFYLQLTYQHLLALLALMLLTGVARPFELPSSVRRTKELSVDIGRPTSEQPTTPKV